MREKLIVKNLKVDNPIKINELVDIIRFSDRTIRNEIKYINTQSEKNGFYIKNIRGKGYFLKIINESKFKLYNEKNLLEDNLTTFSKTDRVNKILEMLLNSKYYITIDEIAEKLKYSRSTVIKDLEEVKKIINKLNLQFETKSSFGLRVIGDEIEIRKAFSIYLYRHENNITILDYKYKELFFKVKEVFLKKIISEKIEISSIVIENIFNHLQILILRLDNKNFITNNTSKLENIKEIKSYKIFKEIVDDVLNLIEKDLSIKVPNIEKEYLLAQIIYKSKMFDRNDISKEKVKKDIEDILYRIDNKFYTGFSKDNELINSLLMHLSALISRARTYTQLKNPYFDEVNARYSAIVAIAINFTNEFSKRWNMNIEKDEIAFIVIHFVSHFEKSRYKKDFNKIKIGIICPTEGGIAQFLKLKLEKLFENSIINILNIFERENIDSYKYIISNSIIENNFKNIVFKINNIFSEEEIEELCFKIKENEKRELDEELDEIYFKRLKGGKSIKYEEILIDLIDELKKDNIVKDNFLDLVMEREKSLSTAYKNGIAGPHAMEMNSNKNCISIVVLDDYINWDGKDINIICLICMRKGSLNIHKKIAKNLFEAINNRELRNKIRLCKNKDDFKKIFI